MTVMLDANCSNNIDATWELPRAKGNGGAREKEATENVVRIFPTETEPQYLKESANRRNKQRNATRETEYREYDKYSRVCRDIWRSSKRLNDHQETNQRNEVPDLNDDQRLVLTAVVVDILADLELLYDCKWGEDEALKQVVMIIKSQLANANLTSSHWRYVLEIGATLKSQYCVDESYVSSMFDIAVHHGLDPFRGTVADSSFQKRYQIVEVSEEASE